MPDLFSVRAWPDTPKSPPHPVPPFDTPKPDCPPVPAVEPPKDDPTAKILEDSDFFSSPGGVLDPAGLLPNWKSEGVFAESEEAAVYSGTLEPNPAAVGVDCAENANVEAPTTGAVDVSPDDA